MIKRSIIVRFQKSGFHLWPNPTKGREYLGQLHRHLFYIEAEIETHHNEREIEFHDFLDFCQEHFKGGNMGALSCESMAERLIEKITARYPKRQLEVRIFEDNEAGARLCFTPSPTPD